MEKNKKIYKRIISFFLVIITLFGLGGCSSSNNSSSEITRYGVKISNLTHGIVKESKVSEVEDLSKVLLTPSRPTTFENYYLVFRFKVTSSEELKEDNFLYAHMDIDGMLFEVLEKGYLIQSFNSGEEKITSLYRSEGDYFDNYDFNATTRVELPRDPNNYVNVTVAWKFKCVTDSFTYKIYFDSNQLDIDGKSINKTVSSKLAVLDKPHISFDEETNILSWDSIENCHYYNIYVDDELYMVDGYEWLTNPTGTERQYVNLKDIGITGNVKIKIRCFALSDLAKPVYSNTVTCSISE